MIKRTTIALFAPVVLVLAAYSISRAAPADPVPAPVPAAQKAPALKPLRLGNIDVSGSLRSRVEGFDWFEASSGDNAYAYSGNIFRIGLSQRRETWDWTAEFAAPFLMGLPGDPVGPGAQGALGLGANYFTANNRNQNAAMIFPKQIYARFTQLGGSKNSTLKIGRFEFLDGSETTPKNAAVANIKANRVNQRLIGAFGWADVGRSFDGFQYSYAKPFGTVTVFAAVPTRGVFQVDGWGWNRSALGYTSFARSWGTGRHAVETRVFGIFYDDFRNGVLKVDNRPTSFRAGEFANIKLWTAGGNSIHTLSTKSGIFDAMAWGVAQGGKWGVQDHSAYAFNVEGGYQPPVLPKLKPWLRSGYSVTSGDDNTADNTHGTFFQILPTPRPYARFPFFNMMNNVDRFGMLTLRPHARWTVSTEYHSLSLNKAADLWYAGGGIFQPWTFGYIGRNTGGSKSLGNLYDANVEYRMNPRFTFTAYYGYAQGLSAMRTIYPAGKNGAFGYGEVLWRF